MVVKPVPSHTPYWVAAAVLLMVVAGVSIWRGERSGQERSQDRFIREAAERYDVAPPLIKAVIWRESRFDPHARGAAGELGLMQLRDMAAQEWADAEAIRGFDHESCLDPRTNILAGTYYLGKLLKRYGNADDPVPYALADYNAGRANVLEWSQGAAQTNSAAFLKQIGFPATKDYVVSVMARRKRYE